MLQVGKYYAPHPGGVETVVRNICEGLAAAGDEVTALCSADSARSSEETLGGVRVVRMSTPGKLLSQPLSLTLPLRLALEARRADIVHLHSPNPLAEAAALALPRSKPIVVSWHSDVVGQRALAPLYSPVTHRLLRRAARVVVATSHHVTHSRFLPRYQAKCEVIPYGIDPAELVPGDEAEARARAERARAEQGGPYVLFVGRLVPYKGVRYLVSAMQSLPEARLVVGGDGPLRGELEAQAAREGLASRVRFLGKVPAGRPLADLYLGCSALVLPSITQAEGFGVVQIEAMACARPVVCTRLDSGVTLVTEDGVTGYVVAPESPQALAHALRAILADPALAARMGEAGRARFAERYSRDAMTLSMRRLYQSLGTR